VQVVFLLQYEEILPIPPNGKLSVRWLRSADGTWYGRKFYEENPICRTGFWSKARTIAQIGIVGWNKRNGHQLKGEYRTIFMMRAGHDFEFFGFRHSESFYVTNGAPKRTGRNGQVPDYRHALEIRTQFLAVVEQS